MALLNSQTLKKAISDLKKQNVKTPGFALGLFDVIETLLHLGEEDLANKTLNNYIKEMEAQDQIVLFDPFIAYYLIKDPSNAKNFIERKYIQSKDKHSYQEDLINYYDRVANYTEMHKLLGSYLDDDLPKEKRLWGLFKQAKVYAKSNNSVLFASLYENIKNLAILVGDLATHSAILLLYAEALYNEAKYQEVIDFVNESFAKELDDAIKAKASLLKLQSLLKLNLLRQASILESSTEELFNKADIETKKAFYVACMDLYEQMGNHFSYASYQSKLQAIKPQETKTKKVKLPPITEPKSEVKEPKSIPEAIDIKAFMQASNALLLRSESRFRDYLIKLGEYFAFLPYKEILIVYKEDSFKGFHYKQQRVYEKKWDDSIIMQSILKDLKEETNLLYLNESNYINLVNQKPFGNETVITTPLYLNSGLAGCITYYLGDTMLYEPYLPLFTLLSGLINSNLITYLLLDKQNKQAKSNEFILKHLPDGIKQEYDGFVYLSDNLAKLLNLDNCVSAYTYLNKIATKDIIPYRKLVEELHNTKNAGEISYLLINGKKLHEQFFVSTDSDKRIVYSIVKDETKATKEAEEFYNSVYYDQEIAKKDLFYLDYNKYVDTKKFAIVLVKLTNLSLLAELYGNHFTDRLLLEILKFFAKSFAVYRNTADSFILVVKQKNDPRAIEKMLKQASTDCNTYIEAINARAKVNYSYAIGLYPSAIAKIDANTLINYLTDIIDVKESKITFYSSGLLKKKLAEKQLVTYISEALSNYEILVYYDQIVDIKESAISFLHAKVNLDPYKVKDVSLYDVIAKRNLTETVTKYLIYRSLFELSEIQKKTNLAFKVCFTLNLQEGTYSDILLYIAEQANFFGIRLNNIIVHANFSIPNRNKYDFLYATDQLALLLKEPFDYYFVKLDEPINELGKEYLASLKGLLGKNNTELVLLNVLNSETLARYTNLGISHYQGKIFHNGFSSKDIIRNLTK